MKNYFKIAAMALGLIFFNACSNDDHNHDDMSGTGKMELSFDHGYKGNALILGANNAVNSNGETLKVTRFNYIVSNVRLHKTDGSVFIYPKNDSYFVINTEQGKFNIDLSNVPAADYNKITIGVGVDMSRFNEGQAAQQAFWEYAQSNNLTWSWNAGYKFINFEGTFTSSSITEPKVFKVHLGKLGEQDNYREFTANFPTVAKVRKDKSPHVHFMVDANKILDGTNKLILAEALNTAGTSAQLMFDAEKAPKIADNAKTMFTIDHIHQSGGH